MESGLEGRNNLYRPYDIYLHLQQVSMESGLKGRNNATRG